MQSHTVIHAKPIINEYLQYNNNTIPVVEATIVDEVQPEVQNTEEECAALCCLCFAWMLLSP